MKKPKKEKTIDKYDDYSEGYGEGWNEACDHYEAWLNSVLPTEEEIMGKIIKNKYPYGLPLLPNHGKSIKEVYPELWLAAKAIHKLYRDRLGLEPTRLGVSDARN